MKFNIIFPMIECEIFLLSWNIEINILKKTCRSLENYLTL